MLKAQLGTTFVYSFTNFSTTTVVCTILPEEPHACVRSFSASSWRFISSTIWAYTFGRVYNIQAYVPAGTAPIIRAMDHAGRTKRCLAVIPAAQQLQAHLEVYYLACLISNAPVESLLQLFKHGTGMFMELPALLELMSMRTHIDAIDALPELRKEMQREEAAAAMARRIAKAEMNRVGQVVVDVGETYDGRDYSHTTVEEAQRLSVRELQAYLRFNQQEVMKGWLKPKLKGLVMAHIFNTLAGLHGDEQEASAGLGYKRLRDTPSPKAQEQQQPAVAQ
ncbi:hypothetical protein QJQ45_008224 [Haematococcus lacustris]|nr:hypothetical protein QJQ45_008224 [Haematococcus lacustris]